ncbi:sugar kinase [Paenarthrobacter ureafaciens]|uniref:sugar kinase n=1 Tax=Paenarthrobacter ureafaciens TaxID=37931 RepID=UPI002265234D|nr:sugar kinase [Paenarthrobacter ureafaciens]MCX8453483.1 sugar kinase [Paenarthrobacter ureafaciens]MCY0973142.1 sugar kinase [Paenarthrobacter ureafaciens]
MTTTDVICVGETMGVVTPAHAEPIKTAEECLLGYGGAESNVAAHLAEFGYRVAWASRLGRDAFGERIIEGLAARGVDVSLVIRDGTAPTGVYFKDPDLGHGARTLYYRSGSAASRMSPRDFGSWPTGRTRWVHTSGINPALSDTAGALTSHILTQAKDMGYKVSFDVNYRPALWPVDVAGPRLQALAEQATVVLVGLDEAETLWGCTSAADVAALLPGPRHLVVKDSSMEAVEFIRDGQGERTARVPAHNVEVIEPVGAGDAFAAGYLAGLLRGDTPEDRLALGHSFAAWTLGTRSDFRPGHGNQPRTFAARTALASSG